MRQRDFPRRPIQQPHAQFILERFDLRAERRLRHPQPLGGAAKAQFLSHRHESLPGSVKVLAAELQFAQTVKQGRNLLLLLDRKLPDICHPDYRSSAGLYLGGLAA